MIACILTWLKVFWKSCQMINWSQNTSQIKHDDFSFHFPTKSKMMLTKVLAISLWISRKNQPYHLPVNAKMYANIENTLIKVVHLQALRQPCCSFLFIPVRVLQTQGDNFLAQQVSDHSALGLWYIRQFIGFSQ